MQLMNSKGANHPVAFVESDLRQYLKFSEKINS